MPDAAIQRAAPEATGTVALLYQQFHDVLIPLEAVRLRYFRNRNGETFKRALFDAVPNTDFRPANAAEPAAQPGCHHEKAARP